ncbi:MAG: NADH-quinone oxidoreductase subunit NuoF [Oligoflexia bacterium]|nr:NADH-quinone oxidoreductase subunit NuoF [Oligoflexia bacterium]
MIKMSVIEPILTKYIGKKDYLSIKKVLNEMNPADVIQDVKKSNLRGRGGAGFPTGIKWSVMPVIPKEESKEKSNKEITPITLRYLVCNADEGEPGTFKDRFIIGKMPHLLIEGMLIAAYAIGARVGYIYIRGEFASEYRILKNAIEEAYQENYLGENVFSKFLNTNKNFSFDLHLYRGAGAYICGEETALLNSLEGKRGEPRIKPPYPAKFGAFGKSTCINNVETLATVPAIINIGAEKYAKYGTAKSGGTRLFSLSGHIQNPGVYEFPLSIKLKDLINHCGGVKDGKKLKAVIPGGGSAPILTAEEIDTLDLGVDYDSLAAAGTMAGSGGIILLDETTCIVEAASVLLKFYEHESCGQCSQCREGSHWLARLFHRIEKGEAEMKELDLIEHICSNMSMQTICAFADAVVGPARSSIKKFRSEFEEHIRIKCCPFKKQKEVSHVL